MIRPNIIVQMYFTKEKDAPVWTGSIVPGAEILPRLAEALSGVNRIVFLKNGCAQLWVTEEVSLTKELPELSMEEIHRQLEELYKVKVLRLGLSCECSWLEKQKQLAITTPMAKALGISSAYYRNKKTVGCLLILTADDELYLCRKNAGRRGALPAGLK